MSRILFKTVVILAFTLSVFAQGGQKSFAQPDPSWSDYQIKKCCPDGFIEVQNYCAQCKAPNVFDVVTMKCGPCPPDHMYSQVTKRCECFSCEPPRAINPANNQCECPDKNGIKMVYNAEYNECGCPANLPLWNGKFCVACPSGTTYDPKQHQCYNCPEGFIRDEASHSCVPGL